MIELADIIAPVAPPPAPPPYEWIALGVALFALILFFVLRLWLKRTRAQRWARAALKRTERELHLGKLDARAAAFQIAQALKCSPSRPQNTSPSPSQGIGTYTSGQSSVEIASPPLEKGEQGGFRCFADVVKSPLTPLFQRGEMMRRYRCSQPPERRGENALNSKAWTEFTQALDQARFSPHPIDTQQATQLLAQAHQWIGRAS
ncbi:MAG: DUF4381 family protein [Burkholderiales bacterium]|nr:DUF4381 family protein [Burkholderiales bacterium]